MTPKPPPIWPSINFDYMNTGQLDRAVDAFQKAITRQPDLPRLYTGLGLSLLKQGKREEAVQQFDRALELDKTPNTLNTLAGDLAVDERIDLNEAVRTLEQHTSTSLSETGTRNGGVEFAVALASLEKGDLHSGSVLFDEALLLYPKSSVAPVAHYCFGIQLIKMGRRSDAVIELREAIQERPDFMEAKRLLNKLQKQ